VDPKKIGKSAVSRKHLRDIMEKNERNKLFGWTLCLFPTEELAKKAGLTLKQYSNQIAKACYLNETDPVAKWTEVYKNAQSVRKWLDRMLKNVKHFHVESKNMDLKIVPGEERRWVGPSGHNIPGFEIFTSPDCRYTEGTYYANLPSYRSGNFVEGVKLVFKKGRAVEISAKKGGEFTKKMAAMDKGACMVGEFSLTDRRFSPISKFMAEILYDENYGGESGNCHLAIGSSYSDAYSGKQSELTKELKKELGFNYSALHWDLINTEDKTVTAHLRNGKTSVIYEKGEFTI
jgi:aminopeptidase